jgi:type II secretory pathway predicted ATPase ExeA
MFLKHWGLSESPFRGGLDPRQYFSGSTQEEALARMQFLVVERRRLGLLLGESGTGKSLLLSVLKRDLESTGAKIALASLLGVDADEFASLVCDAFRLPAASSSSAWQTLSSYINENRFQQLSTVVLLDDVNAPSKALRDQIARLALLDGASTARFTIILALGSENVPLLGHRLLELAELRIDLEPWSAEESTGYLRDALQKGGATRPIFSEAALNRLHELSEGIPRRIKQLADLALLAGAGQQLSEIDADTVEAATAELGIVTI